MLYFLRLIRLPNLLVVVLTQALIFYYLIEPAFLRHNIVSRLADQQLWMLIFACVCVTAAGYVMNDILDVDGDAINRPGGNPVEKLGIASSRYSFFLFTVTGYATSFYVALSLHRTHLLWLYPLSISLLSIYSRYIKPIPLAGNLLVATFCAGVPGLIALAEKNGLLQLWHLEPRAIQVLIIYSLFAFLSTLLRELVKDIEDLEGDTVLSRRTVPVLLGTQTSILIAVGLAVLNILAIALPFVLGWPAFEQFYIVIFISLLCLLIILVIVALLRSKTPKDFHRISQGIKVLMLLGIGMLAII